MDDRTLRIFISSTFLDMFEEREELVRRAFPGLRLLCESRGVTCIEVDLRWGITQLQGEQGLSLSLCFEQIRRSQVVVGLLGEYYGSSPRAISEDLLVRYPWIAGRGGTGCSYTEWELICGVLHAPEPRPEAFFYFREPAYAAGDPKFRDTDPIKVERLDALKDRIRSGVYPLVEGYSSPAAARERIRVDLEDWIERRYPASSKPGVEEREDRAHATFADLRCSHFRGRIDELSKLDRWAEGDGPPLVLTGPEGAGKSALLARWVESRRGRTPPSKPWWRGGQAVADPVPLPHFLSASPDSADWREVLRRLAAGLALAIGVEVDWPDDDDALTPAFANILEMAAKAGRTILVIDGLEQLTGRPEVQDLEWLPRTIPRGVRLLGSTSGGPTLDALRGRKWTEWELPPLGPRERTAAVVSFLQSYGKKLEDHQLNQLTTAREAENPLFLMTAADLLRTVGRHQLAPEVARIVDAGGFEELLDRHFDRWEGDLKEIDPDLVGHAMRLIWASRSGLSDPELLDLLGPDPARPLPWLSWQPLREAIRESMIDRAGLLDFAHRSLRRAVYRRYVVDPAGGHAAHLRLAGYFRGRPWSPRKADELPHQLVQVEAWADLAEILVDSEYLRLAWEDRPSDLLERWTAVEANSARRMVGAYRPWIEATGEPPASAWPVAMILHLAGHHREALDLTARIVRHAGSTGDFARACGGLSGLAKVARSMGRPAEALALLEVQARIGGGGSDAASGAANLINRGAVHLDLGEIEAADRSFDEAERLCRPGRLWRLLGAALGGQALVCRRRGDRKGAERRLREQESTCRRLGDIGSLHQALANRAVLRLDSGDYRGALRLLAEAESICRRLGDHDALRDCLSNQAMTCATSADYDRAMDLYRQAEAACRARGDVAGLAEILAERAWVVATKLGMIEPARRWLDEAKDLARNSGSVRARRRVTELAEQVG